MRLVGWGRRGVGTLMGMCILVGRSLGRIDGIEH